MLDIDLLACSGRIAAHDTGLQATGFRALGERLDDRRVGNVAGLGIAIGCRHHLHAVEITAPLLGHRAGVIQIALVELFDIRRVAAKQI